LRKRHGRRAPGVDPAVADGGKIITDELPQTEAVLRDVAP